MMAENCFFNLENKDNILELTMNAPGNNLMTGDFIVQFVDTVSEIRKISEDSKDIKGLIIRGSGRHFSVGADVDSLVSRTSGELEEIDSTGSLPADFRAQKDAFTSLGKLPFPVVSVASGFCIGSGSEIAVNSHFRICEPSLRAGQPESTFGILPALGGISRTAKICGLAEAADLVMSGDLFNAEQALEKGWADILCDRKQGYETAVKLINFIGSCEGEFSADNCAEYIAAFTESEAE